MNKYKIVHSATEHSYTLCGFEQQEEGKVILVFEAETDDEASFIKNQFLHFEPYKPFDEFWVVEVGHYIMIAGELKKRPHNYEVRTLLILAKDEEEAKRKAILDAKEHGKPYKNGYNQEVCWQYDKIISVYRSDFFDTIDLYRGKPVEVSYKMKSKHRIS